MKLSEEKKHQLLQIDGVVGFNGYNFGTPKIFLRDKATKEVLKKITSIIGRKFLVEVVGNLEFY